MVVYLQTVEEPRPFRLGVVVAKSTGNAVERNSIKRKFRAAIQQRIGHFDQGDNLVLRALPGIAKLDWSEFAAELDQNLKRLNRPRVS
jgi:ribonuclease P protein component